MLEYILRNRKKITFYLALLLNLTFIYAVNRPSSSLMRVSFLLVLLIVLVQLSKYAKNANELSKCILIYYNKCDPDKLYEEVEKQLETVKIYQFKAELLVNKALCLKEMGKLKESYKVLKSIELDSCKFKYIKVVYYLNLSDLYILMSKYDDAVICLQHAKRLAERMLIGKNKYLTFIELNMKDVYVNHMGKLDGAEEFYLKVLEKETTELMKCSIRHSLGVLYLKQGREQEALELFRYVEEKGNKLYIATLAKKYME